MPQQSERHQPKQKEQQLHVEKHASTQPTKRELELRQEVESQRKQIQEQQKQIRQQEWQILLLQQQQAELELQLQQQVQDLLDLQREQEKHQKQWMQRMQQKREQLLERHKLQRDQLKQTASPQHSEYSTFDNPRSEWRALTMVSCGQRRRR